MNKPIPLSSLPPRKRDGPRKQQLNEWRLVCECENQDDGDHGTIRAVIYSGPTKQSVFGQARAAGWCLSYRWKTAVCPKCTGIGE